MYKFSYVGSQEFLVYCANKFVSKFRGKDNLQLPISEDGKVYTNRYPFPNTGVLSPKLGVCYELIHYLNEIISVRVLYLSKLRKMDKDF